MSETASPRYRKQASLLRRWSISSRCRCSSGASGWLYTTDAWWGDARVEAIHHSISVALLALIALHVGGVVVTSFQHRENMIASMFTGNKRPATGDDVA